MNNNKYLGVKIISEENIQQICLKREDQNKNVYDL